MVAPSPGKAITIRFELYSYKRRGRTNYFTIHIQIMKLLSQKRKNEGKKEEWR